MVLIEMHLSNPSLRSQYIWAMGEPWPVPTDEDKYVTRIEVFGPEFAIVAPVVPTGRVLEGSPYPLMDWILADARYVSELMRELAKQVSVKPQ